MSKVTKVVIPAAGLGTRFLPATKAQPKEMLPVVDKPAIQYVIEEAIRNSLTNILVVTGRGKRSIEDHFDQSFELEQLLVESGRQNELELVRAISTLGNIHYIRQGRPLGLGHAVLAAKAHVGTEPFVTMLADDIMTEDSDLLQEMLKLHHRTGFSVLSLMEVPREQIRLYGCAEVKTAADGTLHVASVVEKPEPSEAPSTLAITGRYLFTPEIFTAIENTPSGKNGEFQLTDAIAELSRTQPVLGVVFQRGRYDIGDKLEYLRAVVEMALMREDIGPAFAAELRAIMAREFQES
ncbi:UTP--glucose-1-phosphate uridylyltransferase GalU [Ferrimicrobium acidiphilum]|uniref:UTP--glucose-1-phosphate uridylyltransferase n=1 Tax=Ferrimicrobium acidiphilum DSM 19497 TaxID=1121877 RepID=A0A0D8FWZ8_9ACTN|nr:UTP--glucose-1-phosphate uridylyltransferase GalU [Ferrimicrobium acidiphilum]KJE77788.1 UTP--glucose-1-phosphate uridylyltransferase [Ferrimicrobium acidiphilum DSM 19497]